MILKHWICYSLFLAAVLLTGCATVPQGQEVEPTELLHASEEIPEEQLLDVGILVFNSEEITAEQAEEEGTNAEVRKAETHYQPYQLKETIQQTSHWGAVRVLPGADASTDVLVKAHILHSNGEHLVMEAEVVDASGKVWFNRTYRMDADTETHWLAKKNEEELFQDFYDTVANDMVYYQSNLTPHQRRNIRTVSQLKFAAQFAPDAFQDHVSVDEKQRWTIQRLPADNDPMMARLLKVREREFMYVDTLNGYYEVFYNAMKPSYDNWRDLNYQERQAIKKIKKDAATRAFIGALLVAGAVVLGAQDYSTGGLEMGMVIVGGQLIVDGVNITKGAEMHSAAIKELSESFASEMAPMVMEFEGQKIELTGTAEEQFAQWRQLLREIFYTETGFEPKPLNDESVADTPSKP